jgi:glucose/arabinose dehydrogenase
MLGLPAQPPGGEVLHNNSAAPNRLLAASLLVILACYGCGSASAPIVTPPVTPPPPPSFDLVSVATGFVTPLDIQQPNDSSGRLFVVEQGGHIQIIESTGTRASSPFLDVTGLQGFVAGGELGLVGLVFHPQYSQNRRFFVNYTRQINGQYQSVIAQFTTSATNPEFADPATQQIILLVNQPFNNHKAGALHFGADTFLYIALGDGGNEGDPLCNGQNINNLLGKILRIDVNSTPPAGQTYVIPPNNPFVGKPSGLGEIWLYGLRNPFRFSFDASTGLMWIGDVGQNTYEEIDLMSPQQAGANLGWNIMEGNSVYTPSTCTQTGTTLTGPIFVYDHSLGDDAIIGGYVYHGSKAPALAGAYIFGDYVSGRVWTLTQDNTGAWNRTQITTTASNDLSSFGQDQSGEVYIARITTGAVVRVHQTGQP